MSEPKRTGLMELLRTSVGCQFVIPVYQRNYTWNAQKEVKQYLNDLENVLKGNYKNHFMGIIIYLEKAIDISFREYSIIDGQQRLTTTFLIIYAVKQLLVQNDDSVRAEQIESQYLRDPCHSDKIYKLKPLVSDDDVYRCIVEGRMDDITDKNSNVLKNYHYICSCLNSLFLKGYDANAVLMALNRLYVVCVPISEEDNAQKIFESINATGVKLTAADLIRNYLLMDLKSDVQEEYYVKYWKKIEEYVSKDSKILEQFFRMFLAVKTYNLVPKTSVYREFVEWQDEQNKAIKTLFEDLLEYARIFYVLMNEQIGKLDQRLKDSITDFRKINSDIPLSIVMELFRLYRRQQIDVWQMNELLASINTYMIRRSICDMNSQNISKLFPAVLKKVMDRCNGEYGSIVKLLNQEMVGNHAATSGSYMPTDKQMMELLYRANVYKRPALRIILERLELHQNPAPVDLSGLSVEHLMPQSATEEWLEELDTDIETYQENLHRLGNLTLATKLDNSKMQNLKWEYKNEVLKETAHLILNMEIIPIEKWNLDRIDERTKTLIERVCSIYPYPEVNIAESSDAGVIEEAAALNACVQMALDGQELRCIKKGRVFKSDDNQKGYIIISSKMYPQGDKEKFWFAYRKSRFTDIEGCREQYVVLGCRSHTVTVVKIPRLFMEEYIDKMNTSTDDEGNIKHYHIVLFKNPDGKMTMLLSKPKLMEIDLSDYVVGEASFTL